jgi:hypothetical protein
VATNVPRNSHCLRRRGFGLSPAAIQGMHRLLATIFLSQLAYGQSLSFGVVGGGSVTEDFHNTPQGPSSVLAYSTPKRYLIGAALELRLKAGWSLELDGLFHPLGYTNAFVEPNLVLNSVSPATVVTWEFPVMAKYRFQAGRFTPFLEAGAAFRTTGNLNGANPSHTGFIAGAGVEVPFGRFRFSPEVRYMHWTADPTYSVRTISNQVELLAEFSTAPSSGGHFFGPHISFGAVAGATLTPDFPTYKTSGVAITGTGSYPFTDTQTSGPRSPIVGPEVEVKMGGGFSVEADAILRPESSRDSDTYGSTEEGPFNSGVTTWQFPVLGKYRIGRNRFRPFLEAGPSFRLANGLPGAAFYGATGGAGVETHLWRLAIAPAVRFTHWGTNTNKNEDGAFRNEAELVAGFTF